MKIIKPPRPARNVYRFTCPNIDCRAELEALKLEGKLHYDQRDGDCIEFRCMCCGKPVLVSVNSGQPE